MLQILSEIQDHLKRITGQSQDLKKTVLKIRVNEVSKAGIENL